LIETFVPIIFENLNKIIIELEFGLFSVFECFYKQMLGIHTMQTINKQTTKPQIENNLEEWKKLLDGNFHAYYTKTHLRGHI